MQEKCQVDVQALQSKLWQVCSRYAASVYCKYKINLRRGTKILDLDNIYLNLLKHPLCKFILFQVTEVILLL